MDDRQHLRSAPPNIPNDAALFLDVDGTLIDFGSRPDNVRLLPEVRDALAALSDRLDGALALVSGRPLAQLDRLFAPLRLPAAGLHGYEMRPRNEYSTEIPADTSAWLHALHGEAQRLAARHPGVLVEDKGVSLALHWRQAPAAEQALTEFAKTRIDDASGYRLQSGDHVIEFVPAEVDKGRAIERILQQPPFAGRVPVFIGDDLTDEFGFVAVNRLGGWSVLVGARTDSAARYALADTHAVHAWLRHNPV